MIRQMYSFTHIPPVFKRGQHVLVALFDDGNNLLLSRKHAYPAGIYRFFGGGMHSGELPEDAAVRELEEETGQVIPAAPLLLDTFELDFHESSTLSQYHFTTYLFSVNIGNQPIIPSDDVNDLRVFSKTEFNELLHVYRQLPADLVSPRPADQFRWSDWGSVFGLIHQYVYDHWPE